MNLNATPDPSPSVDIADWLQQQTAKCLLRFLTCGSVDDGKSTLIGRLLYDSQLILDDQLASLKNESRNRTTGEEGIDFSLLVDGLTAEREQGITIDVAYRFFSTDKRKFIVADTPGHEQYTRNMATGASNADLAIVLVDARKGLLTQTRRHSFILSLIGVRHVVLVVNKIDLVDYDESRFDDIESAYRAFAEPLGFDTSEAIPGLRAQGRQHRDAERPTRPGTRGRSWCPISRQIEVARGPSGRPMRFPVQWVNRPNLDFRGFSGTLVSGSVTVGDEVLVAASRKPAKIARIVTMDGDLDRAVAGQAVTLVLDREIDISRGDVLAQPGETPEYSNQFQARLVWMHEEPAYHGRSYLLKIGTQIVPATMTTLKHRTNVNTLEQIAGHEARAQRGRHGHARHRQADRLRQLWHQSPDRRLHPHRPADQCHARRRGHRFRPAAGAEPDLSELRREPRGARPAEGSGGRRSSGSPGFRVRASRRVANLLEKRLTAGGQARLHP